MLSKLRRRFLLDMLVMAFIIILGSSMLLVLSSYTYARNSANENMSDFLENVTPGVVHVEKDSAGKPETASVDRGALEQSDDMALLLLSEDGDVLSLVTSSRSVRQELEEELDSIVQELDAAGGDAGMVLSKSFRFMAQPLKGVGTKVALLDRSSELDSIYFQLRMYIVVAMIILILIALLCDYMARRSILPVDEAIRNQQQFIADASHELKTPLTVMLANLDILSSSPDATIRESERWVDNTRQEAKRMSKLVNEMLFLARSDAAMDMHYNFRLINFADAVDEVVLTTEALAFERNIILEASLPEQSMVVGDYERLKQVVMILVENATKYVDENGKIVVELATAPRRTEVLTVTNTGTPIPPEKSAHIFDRFYRVDESRVREQGGYGLGLSIAQKIVQKHNGEIALDYSNESGTRFSVRLPHAQSLRAPELSEEPDAE